MGQNFRMMLYIFLYLHTVTLTINNLFGAARHVNNKQRPNQNRLMSCLSTEDILLVCSGENRTNANIVHWHMNNVPFMRKYCTCSFIFSFPFQWPNECLTTERLHRIHDQWKLVRDKMLWTTTAGSLFSDIIAVTFLCHFQDVLRTKILKCHLKTGNGVHSDWMIHDVWNLGAADFPKVQQSQTCLMVEKVCARTECIVIWFMDIAYASIYRAVCQVFLPHIDFSL